MFWKLKLKALDSCIKGIYKAQQCIVLAWSSRQFGRCGDSEIHSHFHQTWYSEVSVPENKVCTQKLEFRSQRWIQSRKKLIVRILGWMQEYFLRVRIKLSLLLINLQMQVFLQYRPVMSHRLPCASSSPNACNYKRHTFGFHQWPSLVGKYWSGMWIQLTLIYLIRNSSLSYHHLSITYRFPSMDGTASESDILPRNNNGVTRFEPLRSNNPLPNVPFQALSQFNSELIRSGHQVLLHSVHIITRVNRIQFQKSEQRLTV